MTIAEVIELVREITGVRVDYLGRKGNLAQTNARYLAIVLMDEFGYANTAIAAALNIERTTTYNAINEAGHLLENDPEFKKIYKASGERMADMEEKK
ncbi:hypothetical protein [Mucilaginibacter sp.]|uniref:hypothetical protein n=1 Tax=Mucilaginibacter sp. TaxID=1882438 RepID=UPI003263C320